MFSVGIVGLPNVGKSTLFKALTKKQVDISDYPFCTIEPNVGVVAVPDNRLKKLAQIFKPPKVTPTVIEFIDIAGLVKNAHQGEGLGNQFLAHIREVDVICQVVRVFESERVSHVDGSINPQRDIETVNFEIVAKDLETVERRLEKSRKQAKSGDKAAIQEVKQLEQIKDWLDSGKLVKDMPDFFEYQELVAELFLLTAKPVIYVYNINESQIKNLSRPIRQLADMRSLQKLVDNRSALLLDIKIEEEASELSESELDELKIESQLDQLIRICYDILKLITFYTIAGGKELRAWTLPSGSNALEAAGKVHSDFQERFIKTEVIDCQKLIAASSTWDEASLSPRSTQGEAGAPSGREAWNKARESGQIRTEGKEYKVEDGDVIEFKI